MIIFLTSQGKDTDLRPFLQAPVLTEGIYRSSGLSKVEGMEGSDRSSQWISIFIFVICHAGTLRGTQSPGREARDTYK